MVAKIINNKQEVRWMDLQRVTHFRNALPLMDIDNLMWKNLRTQFKQDFRATTTVSSVIQKFPEIIQKDKLAVIQYVSRHAEMLLELKTSTDVLLINRQLQLNAAETAAYNEIEKALTV
jgi:hypothetical protein